MGLFSKIKEKFKKLLARGKPQKITIKAPKRLEKKPRKYAIVYKVEFKRYCRNDLIGDGEEIIYQISDKPKPDYNYAYDQFYTMHGEISDCSPSFTWCIECYDYAYNVEVLKIEEVEES